MIAHCCLCHKRVNWIDPYWKMCKKCLTDDDNWTPTAPIGRMS